MGVRRKMSEKDGLNTYSAVRRTLKSVFAPVRSDNMYHFKFMVGVQKPET